MGKKHDAKLLEQSARKAAKAAKGALKEVKSKTKAAAEKVETIAAQTLSPKAPAKPKTARPKKTAGFQPSNEQVALRAYYVSEKRQREGLPGNTDSDWIEAERQLKLEASAPAARPKTAAKRSPAAASKSKSKSRK